jgi:hypothetical protein
MAIKLDDLLNPTTVEVITEQTRVPIQQEYTLPDIDTILREWSWRCDKGYPDFNNISDRIRLQEVLDEMGIKLPFDRLVEATTSPVSKVVVKDAMKSAESLELFLMNKYVYPGQEIEGISLFYKSLKTPKYSKLVPLVLNGGTRKLKDTTYELTVEEQQLLQLISSTVRLSNGEPSEFWFAILYNGRVKGGVAGETGIVSDVDVKDAGVSLKNYGRTGDMPSSIDFGTLDRESARLFNSILDLFVVLTGIELKASKTRNEINQLLDFFNKEENLNDINAFLDISKDSKIGVIKRYGDKIRTILGNERADYLVTAFVNSVNSVIKAKLSKVDWWAIILKNKSVYIHSSDSLIDLYASKESKLSSNIANFKGGHLYVTSSSVRSKQA